MLLLACRCKVLIHGRPAGRSRNKFFMATRVFHVDLVIHNSFGLTVLQHETRLWLLYTPGWIGCDHNLYLLMIQRWIHFIFLIKLVHILLRSLLLCLQLLDFPCASTLFLGSSWHLAVGTRKEPLVHLLILMVRI